MVVGRGKQQDPTQRPIALATYIVKSSLLPEVRQGFGSISGIHHACNLSGELIRLSIINHLQSVFAMDFDISQALELFGRGFTGLLNGFSYMWKMMREYSDVVTVAIPIVFAIIVGIFCRYHTRR